MTRPLGGVALWRWLIGVVGVAAVVVAIVTSGKTTNSPTIASVNGSKITLASFDHWLNSSALAAHSTSATVPPFVPDAPNYTRCSSFVSSAMTKAKKKVPAAATLVNDCRELRSALAEEVMQFLISSRWILAQGQTEGVVVTQSQIQKAIQTSLPKSTGLVSYLKGNGLSRDDLAFEAKVSLIAQKLGQRHAGPAPTITATQIAQFYNTNKSSMGGKTLAQESAAIKQTLIAQKQAPTVEKYLTGVQKRYQTLTTCQPGYKIAYYCSSAL